MMLSRVMPFSSRSALDLSFIKFAPAFEVFAIVAPFSPTMDITSSMPSIFDKSFWIFSCTALVCANVKPSGSCSVTKI